MTTREDYDRFLAEVRKQTGIEALTSDDAGLVSVNVDEKYNVNLQFVEASGKVLCFIEVATLPYDAPKAVYRDLPLVRTTGKVTMPATATVDFSDALRAGQVQGKVYVLAEAGSFDLPETLEDWTITPALAEGQGEPKLIVEDGKLKFKMGIQPMIIMIR